MPINSFKDLRIWQEGYALSLQIYAVTKEFPRDERYGLITQMRRAAVSVPSNIAEGFSRSPKEYAHFLSIACGSSRELHCQCLIAKDLGYLAMEHAQKLVVRYDGLAAGIHACMAMLKKRQPSHRH